MFKSNEGLLEENEKVLVAHEYSENNKVIRISEVKKVELAGKLSKIESEMLVREEESEIVKR